MDNDKSIKTLTRSKLRPFRYHPYKVKEDEDMANLVNSIKEEGVISPIIVRKVGKDNYENTVRSSKIQGLSDFRYKRNSCHSERYSDA